MILLSCRESVRLLYEIFSPNLPEDKLRVPDQLIIIETMLEMQIKQGGIDFSSVKSMEEFGLEKVFAEKPLGESYEVMHRMHRELEEIILKEGLDLGDRNIASVLIRLREIPALIWLLLRLENLLEKGEKRWERVLDKAYELAKERFIALDSEIATIERTDFKKAEHFSAFAMAVVLGSQDRMEERMFQRLFVDMGGELGINARTHRYIYDTLTKILNHKWHLLGAGIVSFYAAIVFGVWGGAFMVTITDIGIIDIAQFDHIINLIEKTSLYMIEFFKVSSEVFVTGAVLSIPLKKIGAGLDKVVSLISQTFARKPSKALPSEVLRVRSGGAMSCQRLLMGL